MGCTGSEDPQIGCSFCFDYRLGDPQKGYFKYVANPYIFGAPGVGTYQKGCVCTLVCVFSYMCGGKNRFLWFVIKKRFTANGPVWAWYTTFVFSEPGFEEMWKSLANRVPSGKNFSGLRHS